MSVFAKMRDQPEFKEETWQYINRRVSEWRIVNGRVALQKNAALFARIEKDFGVERGTLLALWGVESAYGDPLVQQNHMKPIIPALAALAWNEPRRRAYWDSELINALRIVDKGWSTPEEMRGSWAGAMGHTQWMPEVWLNVGFDYDGDGRVSHSAVPPTRWPRPRAISSIAANIVPASTGAMKSLARAARAKAAALMRHGPHPASPAPTASRFRARTTAHSSGRRSRAGRRFCWDRISMRCEATIRR